jgi:hypothetical protein
MKENSRFKRLPYCKGVECVLYVFIEEFIFTLLFSKCIIDLYFVNTMI